MKALRFAIALVLETFTLSKSASMIKNYLKIAFRSLWRSKAHSMINVIGLSLGIASCLLIMLFIKDELTFDQFHTKANRIFRAYGKEDWGENQKFFYTTTPFPLAGALKDNFEEIEQVVRINNIGPQVKVNENLFAETVTIAGQHFFDVFDFEIVKGDQADILGSQSGVVLTKSIAQKYFGNVNPLNKNIAIQLNDQFEEFTVKAVVADPPTNSSIQFSILISDLNYPKLYSERTLNSGWFNITPETYVLLKDNADADKLVKKFSPLFKSILGEKHKEVDYFIGLQPLVSIHLDTSFPVGIAPVNDPRYSYILSAIALLILVVACINFVTLSVGRSLKRAKEVGIRKVVGAERSQLVFQFIGEAIIITIIALVVGFCLSLLNLPLFNDLSGKQLVMKPDSFLLFVILGLVCIIGLFAGSYPAFLLSGFKPIAILKGSIQGGSNKQRLRKMLVGVQFVLSIFLISSTLLMQKQLNYLQNKNLGFDREQLAVVQLNVPNQGRLGERVQAGFEKAKQFKTELQKISGVAAVCASSHDFGNGAWTNIGYTDVQGTYRTLNINLVDDQYIQTLKMKIVQGRSFSDDNPADAKRSVIVNEALVKQYGWKDPIGQRLPGKNFIEHEVIGVVKDFHYASLYTAVEPLLLSINPMIPLSGLEDIGIDGSPIPKLLVRIRSGETAATLEQVKSVWNRLTGNEEFNFSFVDQALNAQYRNDQNLGRIVSIATILAIVIGSLGLYGLASLAMQNRIKEISIRKVLGATEQSLLVLLSGDYVLLIVISLLISVPMTWYLMSGWLATFEYRVAIGVDIFLIAGGISLFIALLTISYQAIKTAWTQPAKTLKYE